MKLAFVRSELLQNPGAAGGANDGHRISRLNLFIDKLFQSAPENAYAFERQTEVVNHDSDGAVNFPRVLASPAPRGGATSLGFPGAIRLDRPDRRFGSAQVVNKVSNFLRLVVLKNLNLIRCQISHGLSVLIEHNGIDLDQIGGYLDDIRIVGFLRLLLRTAERRCVLFSFFVERRRHKSFA